MSASPWPHLDAEAAPLSSVWQTPADSFRELARRSRRDPEAVALGDEVGNVLAEYLDGAITLREFARRHTPYQRFRAVRVWGPDDERFRAIMPVLDDLIALHRDGKTPERTVDLPDVARVAADGKYDCSHCSRTVWLTKGAPQLCARCKSALLRTGTEGWD